MSRLVRLERSRPTASVATAIATFLAEHDLSPGSQRVYAGGLRSLQDGLGANTPLAMVHQYVPAMKSGIMHSMSSQ